MMTMEKAQRIIEAVAAADENRIGPTPFGVVGRRAGSVPGFNCTADHKKLGVAWDAATLDKYLANPRAMVPDTSMVYAGLKNDAEAPTWSGISKRCTERRHGGTAATRAFCDESGLYQQWQT